MRPPSASSGAKRIDSDIWSRPRSSGGRGLSMTRRLPADRRRSPSSKPALAFVAYSPLGRGFLSGQIRSLADLAPNDYRRSSPRFAGENFDRNLQLVDRIQELARARDVTASQLALAWLLAREPFIVPIPGTRSLDRLAENAGAADLTLSREELAAIDELAPKGVAVGDRYPSMALING